MALIYASAPGGASASGMNRAENGGFSAAL
jgi:hypothetical protein